jgi:hypothetical protein
MHAEQINSDIIRHSTSKYADTRRRRGWSACSLASSIRIFDGSARDRQPGETSESDRDQRRGQHQLEQRRRSQVRADAGSLADPRGACGACHGGGAAAAESRAQSPPRAVLAARSGPVLVAAAGRGCGAQSRRPGPRGTCHAGCADRTGCRAVRRGHESRSARP